MLYGTGIFFAATATGLFFFGGLRYTVNKLMTSKFAWGWAMASFAVRMSVSGVVLYAMARNNAGQWGIGLAGMLAGRMLVLRFTRQKKAVYAPEP